MKFSRTERSSSDLRVMTTLSARSMSIITNMTTKSASSSLRADQPSVLRNPTQAERMNTMQILKYTDYFQLEDWSDNFDFDKYPRLLDMRYCVGCYPIAKRTLPDMHFIQPHERMRIGLNFRTLEAAEECFKSLTEGSKTIKDYADHAHEPRHLYCID